MRILYGIYILKPWNLQQQVAKLQGRLPFPFWQLENTKVPDTDGAASGWCGNGWRFIRHEVSFEEVTYWVFPKIGVPQNGWFIIETPIKNGWFGVPIFSETSYSSKKGHQQNWITKSRGSFHKKFRVNKKNGWTTPSEKNMNVKMASSSPIFGVRNSKKCFKNHHLAWQQPLTFSHTSWEIFHTQSIWGIKKQFNSLIPWHSDIPPEVGCFRRRF